ncbi:MAG: hypothetical protein L3J13_00400 [Devosiaceae bacterium]|nr:hypothetical protein [Devosiaceae bacterium]
MAFAIIATGISAGNGQESPDEGLKRELEEGVEKTPKSDSSKKIDLNQSLDDLFAELKLETDSKKARRIERVIWLRWSQSGSETVDVLMTWAALAMKEQNWASALDLLDQVVVMAPQYAEGWNRRATLYYHRSQFGQSISDIEQVLRLEQRHFGALMGLGNILQRLDNEKRALKIWKNVLAIYPANKNAQKTVAKLEKKLSGRGI